MWIEADAAHREIVNVAKLDSIAVVYKGSGQYAVVGSIGDRNIILRSGIRNAKDASDWVDVIKAKIAP